MQTAGQGTLANQEMPSGVRPNESKPCWAGASNTVDRVSGAKHAPVNGGCFALEAKALSGEASH